MYKRLARTSRDRGRGLFIFVFVDVNDIEQRIMHPIISAPHQFHCLGTDLSCNYMACTAIKMFATVLSKPALEEPACPLPA